MDGFRGAKSVHVSQSGADARITRVGSGTVWKPGQPCSSRTKEFTACSAYKSSNHIARCQRHPPNTTFAERCDSTDDGESESVVDDPNALVEDPRGYVDHPLAQTNYPTTPETDEMTSQVDETRPSRLQRPCGHDGRQRTSSRRAHRAARPA